MASPEDFTAYANGLRALADWLEAHPEIGELPETTTCLYGLDEKEEAAVLVRALGSCKKAFTEEMLHITKEFGPIQLRALFYREKVCVRRVVGVETIPARFVPAQTIPASTREIVEWDCAPILAPTEQS